MAETTEEHAATKGGNLCLDITLRSAPSQLKANDGNDISFTRAILTVRNVCKAETVSIVPCATLGQESGTVQDVSNALSHSTPTSIRPGETVSWDVYELLLPAHQGTASKIHMFGYRAALNWRFDLAAWAEYRTSDPSEALKTPVLRWSFRWSVADPATRAVGLTIEEIKT